MADSNLTCYAIGMENPVPAVDGDMAAVTCTSIPTANAYDRPMRSPVDTFRMKGTHCCQRIDGK